MAQTANISVNARSELGSRANKRLRDKGLIPGVIYGHAREPQRLCVCLDTAHLFAAGYDISSESGVRRTFREFDRVIGRDRLVAIHVNDSKTDRGSRVDRHEHIGKGRIGLDAFRFIMQSPRFRKIPKVLETPKGDDLAEDVINLKTLHRLAQPGRS